mmetsp:Transcript_32774/g.68346  ORF Transcript_32774/g.68346 Transcript_32774/m.68346 type:complete len:705 (-) Transcript_32774:677-2791(-)
MSWTTQILEDPLWQARHHHGSGAEAGGRRLVKTCLLQAECLVSQLLPESAWNAWKESGSHGQVALADYTSRQFVAASDEALSADVEGNTSWSVGLEPLELLSSSSKQISRRRRHKRASAKPVPPPYILERSDVCCSSPETIRIVARVLVFRNGQTIMSDEGNNHVVESNEIKNAIDAQIRQILSSWSNDCFNIANAMNYVATSVLQHNLRQELQSETGLNAVAFVANAAILPRKSGASQAPMASPPAVPFLAPEGSEMTHTVRIPLSQLLVPFLKSKMVDMHQQDAADSVVLSGLLVPRGVSLIVGGGYHGKSTLLRAVAAGVYNKIPGDGREFCVTVSQALNIRAEDGRYVNNCNVSGFIGNLPAPPPTNGHIPRAPDTKHFSTGEASGSTSQAANVIEALEMKTTAFLVDEDVGAANFLARDGRMRALVMDESITPLLYRVNGLYQTHGVSSIVVVGGVGDWLDVPHHVILMEKYSCFDATAKARSVSKQFSHGHVQYAGRGVVHRLEWDQDEYTPIPRRPSDETAKALDRDTTALGLMEGGTGLAFHQIHSDDSSNSSESDVDGEDDRYIDMSRCEQLLGKKPQLYGCGLAALWILKACRENPGLGLSDLLDRLDREIDQNGLLSVLAPDDSATQHELIEHLGFMYRPRRLEVGQAICRLRGILFEELPIQVNEAKIKARAEEERKKREMMEIWNARRKKG